MGINRTFIWIVGNVVEILLKPNTEYDYIQQINALCYWSQEKLWNSLFFSYVSQTFFSRHFYKVRLSYSKELRAADFTTEALNINLPFLVIRGRPSRFSKIQIYFCRQFGFFIYENCSLVRFCWSMGGNRRCWWMCTNEINDLFSVIGCGL